MLFHENRLLADDSHVHVISYLIFVEVGKNVAKNLLSVTVVIGGLRVKYRLQCEI